MPDYKQMLKEAEDREAGVKKVFQQYDIDGGGSIDPAEITCVMEDLGLLSGLKTDVTSFVASAFARYDENDDGALSFEEFKKFYNAAKDDAQGRKPPPAKPSGGGKTSGLDSSTNDARQRLKEEKARKKAEEAEKIRAENAAMKARMKEKSKAGGDSKALDADLLAARKEAADKRKAEKEAAAAKMAAENKAQKAKLKKCAPTPAPARAPACGGTRRARSVLAHAAQRTANWHIHCKSMACAFCSAARGPAPTTTCWTTWRPTAHRWRMRGTRRRRRAQTKRGRAPRTPRTARRS